MDDLAVDPDGHPDRCSDRRPDRNPVSSSFRRSRRSTLAAGVAAALLSGVFGATGCGSSGDEDDESQVDLAELSDRQEDFDGATVRTSGVVRRFDDIGGTYFVIEDAERNRVRIEPADRFADLVGDRVVVVGRFAYDDVRGRTLEVSEIVPPT